MIESKCDGSVVPIPILFTLIAEIIMTIAISALIGQNLDMAAVAGLLIVIGTSTNDQIVITDEILRGSNEERIYSWKSISISSVLMTLFSRR